jgi:diadenosine tetraphosphatase ApaH/serine/threonine PP2A family protein phosphatase
LRIAILTDIHANREAFSACLAHAERTQPERYAFLGDLIGYGADPCWVVDTVMTYAANGAICVLGNHDEAVLQRPRAGMQPDARRAIEWTRAQLNPVQLDFIARLPLKVEDGKCLFVHANAWAPEQWEYITSAFDARSSIAATTARYTFCGHIHEPTLYNVSNSWRAAAFKPVAGVSIPLGTNRRWLAIAGSVGQPRDGVVAACYAMFDTARASITFYRVPYDVETAAAKVRAAGLPRDLALRLEIAR